MPLLSVLAVSLAACDGDESCAPGCRPAADGLGVEIVLPCEDTGFTEAEPCHVEYNRVEVLNDAGETEQFCTDVLLHQCVVRSYAGGEQYRVCVVDAPVVGAAALQPDEDEARCEAVVERTAIPPDDLEAAPQNERICVDCDHWFINVRVDRRKAEAEIPPAAGGVDPECQAAPDDFCSGPTIGYDFCAYETMGCNWPPSPYL